MKGAKKKPKLKQSVEHQNKEKKNLAAKIKRGNASKEEKDRYQELTGGRGRVIKVETQQEKERRLELRRLGRYINRSMATPQQIQRYLDLSGKPNISHLKVETIAEKEKRKQYERENNNRWYNERKQEGEPKQKQVGKSKQTKDEFREKRRIYSRIRTGKASQQDKQRYIELLSRKDSYNIKPESKSQKQKRNRLSNERYHSVVGKEKHMLAQRIKSNRASTEEEQRYLHLIGKSSHKIRRETSGKTNQTQRVTERKRKLSRMQRKPFKNDEASESESSLSESSEDSSSCSYSSSGEEETSSSESDGDKSSDSEGSSESSEDSSSGESSSHDDSSSDNESRSEPSVPVVPNERGQEIPEIVLSARAVDVPVPDGAISNYGVALEQEDAQGRNCVIM